MMAFLRKWLKNKVVLSCLIYIPLTLLIIAGICMAYMLANFAMLVLAIAVVLIVVFSVMS